MGLAQRAVFFIKTGSVSAVLPEYKNFEFIEVRSGYYFGEVDLLHNYETRKYTFMAKEACDLLVLNKKNFKDLFLKKFRDVGTELLRNAIVRDVRMLETYNEALALCKKSRRKRRKSTILKSSFFRGSVDYEAFKQAVQRATEIGLDVDPCQTTEPDLRDSNRKRSVTSVGNEAFIENTQFGEDHSYLAKDKELDIPYNKNDENLHEVKAEEIKSEEENLKSEIGFNFFGNKDGSPESNVHLVDIIKKTLRHSSTVDFSEKMSQDQKIKKLQEDLKQILLVVKEHIGSKGLKGKSFRDAECQTEFPERTQTLVSIEITPPPREKRLIRTKSRLMSYPFFRSQEKEDEEVPLGPFGERESFQEAEEGSEEAHRLRLYSGSQNGNLEPVLSKKVESFTELSDPDAKEKIQTPMAQENQEEPSAIRTYNAFNSCLEINKRLKESEDLISVSNMESEISYSIDRLEVPGTRKKRHRRRKSSGSFAEEMKKSFLAKGDKFPTKLQFLRKLSKKISSGSGIWENLQGKTSAELHRHYSNSNRNLKRSFGTDKEEIVGKKIDEIRHFESENMGQILKRRSVSSRKILYIEKAKSKEITKEVEAEIEEEKSQNEAVDEKNEELSES